MAETSGNPAALVLRSATFHVASVLASLAFLPLYPLLAMPADKVWWVLKRYVEVQLWLLRLVCGQDYRVAGAENLPPGPSVVAARHESLWETLVLPYLLDNPVVILKQEIAGYPLAGPIVRKLRHVAVDRSGNVDAARRAFDAVRAEAKAGRSVLIFPSGTRDPERRDRVQSGVALVYRSLGRPCVPVVHDSGRYWPHNSWLRLPGTIRVRVLPAIPPGLTSKQLVAELEVALQERP